MKLAIAFFIAALTVSAFGQAKPAAKPIIFAVLNDGNLIEPIAFIANGKLEGTVDGGDDAAELAKFNTSYLKLKSNYKLIFGGVVSGSATVRSTPGGECMPNMVEVDVISKTVRLKGKVMALATNAPAAKRAAFRRMPTVVERREVEKLVRKELKILKIDSGKLEYHNLTAVDIDQNGKPEFIGSYWIADTPKSRGLAFLIAERDANGKWEATWSSVGMHYEHQLMSRDLSDLDRGIYHELLLDVYDVENDGTAEVFTYIQSFEGANFFVYKRNGKKWDTIFRGTNYHCGY